MTAKSRRILTIASLLLAGVAFRSLLFWDPGREVDPTDESWFFRPSETSPRIIFALAAALVWRRWPTLCDAARQPGSPGAALPALLTGVALYLWGHHSGAPDLILASFVALALGVSLLHSGVRLARALVLPLVVLLFAIPIPAVMTNEFFYTLQLWTARDATYLLRLAGMPLFREANAIYGAHEQFMVIDTCAGLRFIEVLTLLAVAYAGWSPAGRLRTLLRIALAPPIAYVFNLFRVCVLITNPTSELSTMHSVQGWAVFLAAVSCLAIVDRAVLSRLPDRRPRATETPRPVAAAARAPGDWPLAVPIVLAVLAAVSIWMPQWQIPPESRFVPISLPMRIGDWRMGSALPLDLPYLGTVRYSHKVHRPYRRDGEEVFLFIAVDDRTDRGRSLLTRKNPFLDGGWIVDERRAVTLGALAPRAESVLAHSRERRALSITWYERTGRVLPETLRALLAADQSALRRSTPGRVIRIATPVAPGPRGPEIADARLRAFADSLASALRDTNGFATRLLPREANPANEIDQ